MALAGLMKAICMVIALAAAVASPAKGLTCPEIIGPRYLSSCIPFVVHQAQGSLKWCCRGVRHLYRATKANRAGRQAMCHYLKSYSRYPGVSFGTTAKLPAHCGVNLPSQDKISPYTDCSRV